VVLHDFFKKIEYVNTEHYIPHRHKEGFGVHIKAIEEMAERGCALIMNSKSFFMPMRTEFLEQWYFTTSLRRLSM
jgi:hypothetical protein